MTSNALQGDRLMGVALLREGWHRDYFGKPAIYKTFGVGKIIDHDQLDDGRYNLVLEGLYRVRLVEEFATIPFRTGRVQVLMDPPINDHRPRIVESMKDLRESSDRIAALLPALQESLMSAWSAHPHPLVVVNHLASAVVIDAYDRQSILEQDDPLRRVRLLQIQLRNILQQLENLPARAEEIQGED